MSPLAENSGSTVVAAVIGLGSMGLGMALSMKRAGLDVVGYDVTPAAVDRFVDEGGRGASTPAAAAKDADIVVSVVVNGAQTEAAVRASRCRACDEARCRLHLIGNHGSSRRARSGRAGGSSRPALSRRADFGGAAKAARGELTIMASGSKQAFDTARSGLDAMAAKVYELGDEAGKGAAFKMINQLLAGVHIAAACEAITFAAKQGLDLDKVYEVITASAGNSPDVRKPRAACAGRRLYSAQQHRDLRQGSRYRPRHGPLRALSGTARGSRPADVSGRLRGGHGP